MYLFEEVENKAKYNIWPKLVEFLDTAKELLSKELLYINSSLSCSGVTIKKIILLILFALFSSILTVFFVCALIVRLVLQSFPTVDPSYLLLASALIFGLILTILTFVIKKQIVDLKSEILPLITHLKGYNYGPF